MSWDFFISHAHEDKMLVAAPLAYCLNAAHFAVWYDDFSLHVGDSLLASINRGLAESQFGITIISEAFLTKPWPQRELAAMMALGTQGKTKLLPVWHNLSAAFVADHAPLLADLVAVNTSRGLQAVAEKLVEASFPARIRDLPLSTALGARSEDFRLAREGLRELLAERPNVEDIYPFLSAYQLLLASLSGYAPLLVPGHKITGPVPFHFALITPHGVTGPIGLTFVLLGPTSIADDLNRMLRTIDESIGDGVELLERPANDYLRQRYVGEFPRVEATVRQLSSCIDISNVHFDIPQVWNFSFLIIAGRRGLREAPSAEVTNKLRVGLEVASYDRLLDESASRYL